MAEELTRETRFCDCRSCGTSALIRTWTCGCTTVSVINDRLRHYDCTDFSALASGCGEDGNVRFHGRDRANNSPEREVSTNARSYSSNAGDSGIGSGSYGGGGIDFSFAWGGCLFVLAGLAIYGYGFAHWLGLAPDSVLTRIVPTGSGEPAPPPRTIPESPQQACRHEGVNSTSSAWLVNLLCDDSEISLLYKTDKIAQENRIKHFGEQNRLIVEGWWAATSGSLEMCSIKSEDEIRMCVTQTINDHIRQLNDYGDNGVNSQTNSDPRCDGGPLGSDGFCGTDSATVTSTGAESSDRDAPTRVEDACGGNPSGADGVCGSSSDPPP